MTADQNIACTACPSCGATLITDGFADGTTILCAQCRYAFEYRPLGDRRQLSRKAMASLVLGVAAALFSCLTAVPGIVLGVMALIEIRRGEETVKGRRIALTGIAASLLLGTLGAAIVWALLLPAIQMLGYAK